MNEFFQAVQAGDLAAVQRRVAADPSLLKAKNERGLDAFTVARYSRQNEVAEFLLESGVELDIFSASMAGATGRVCQLLAADATLVSAYSHDGWTPLHLACFFGNQEAAEVLLAHGANVEARSLNPMRNTPLHAAAAGRSNALAALLAQHGADVNARQEGGWTPLHAAAQSGCVEMAVLLLSLGADSGLRADNNQNALDLALTGGHAKVAELLESTGAAH